MEKKNVIVEKVLEFGVEVVKFCELLEEKKKYIIAWQLLKCGTSIGANVFEAQHPESVADFIHKMKLALRRRMGLISGFACAKEARIIRQTVL